MLFAIKIETPDTEDSRSINNAIFVFLLIWLWPTDKLLKYIIHQPEFCLLAIIFNSRYVFSCFFIWFIVII